MSKKYKLLKDLPGCPKGTVFVTKDDNWFELDSNHAIDQVLRIRADFVTDEPLWFQPIPDEPEHPYPWQPKDGESYWTSTELLDDAFRVICDNEDFDRSVFTAGLFYRTKDDVQLRLKAEPLVNRAVGALLNSRSSVQGHHWHVFPRSWVRGDGYIANGVCTAVDCAGVIAQNHSDAKAITALFNFFLTNPHA
jgi:hypothetical protein